MSREHERHPSSAARLLTALENLNIHRKVGLPPNPNKPLTLLWAIGRHASGGTRLVTWAEFEAEVRPLLVEFGRRGRARAEYPFWHLRTSGLWEVVGFDQLTGSSPTPAALKAGNAVGGLTAEAARLLTDRAIRSAAVAVLCNVHLAVFDQRALLARVGLLDRHLTMSYASAALDSTVEGPGPASRTEVTTLRVVRATAVARAVKALYEHRCQACGFQLWTPGGLYSEAAHIRPLGSPHNGPDHLSNLLCLCPNDHVQFDALAIFIDANGTVRSAKDYSAVGILHRHPAHHILESHLLYQRQRCGVVH